MSVSLLITTYNWESALNVVLKSVARQTCTPLEVLIADDGSGEQTKEIIAKYQANFPCPVHHIWQEDKGFRAGAIRNKAIAQAQSDYIIIIDGDMIIHQDFVKDHIAARRPGCFVQGRRIRLREQLSQAAQENERMHFSCVTPGVLRKLQNIRLPRLSRAIQSEDQKMRHIRSCNMSFWTQDCMRVNGFNEDMHGWGLEDGEFVRRLFNSGINRSYVRFAALAYHLHHPEKKNERLSQNEKILNDCRDQGLQWCADGIDKYKEIIDSP